jgi:hypothetical protein
MEKKLFGIFDIRIRYILHLILIVGFLFLGFFIGDKYFNLSKLNYFQMGVYWLIILFIGDSIAEKIFNV